MKGSWQGLNRDVMIGNWNNHRTKDSVIFFADRGHHQFLATYYDHQNWQSYVRNGLEASNGIANVDGIMYTTWSNDLWHLEYFFTLIRD